MKVILLRVYIIWNIRRFECGIYIDLHEKDTPAYKQKLLEFLEEKITNKNRHLKNSISHIVRGRKKQVIVVLDNADQRDYEVQQTAFIIAQNLARDWEIAVFIACAPTDIL